MITNQIVTNHTVTESLQISLPRSTRLFAPPRTKRSANAQEVFIPETFAGSGVFGSAVKTSINYLSAEAAALLTFSYLRFLHPNQVPAMCGAPLFGSVWPESLTGGKM